MKILALIPARGGSKRLPGKNTRILGKKPLIVWSIDIVKGLPDICDVLVSTDAPDISAIASNAGAMVPWLRPKYLSDDCATSVDVALHALNWYEDVNGPVDGILLLQPTSPFRRVEDITRGINLFANRKPCAVVGVSPTNQHPFLCLKIEDQRPIPYVEGADLTMRSQGFPKAYVVSGAFYLITPSILRYAKTFYGDDWVPLIINGIMQNIDIDTLDDWRMAEYYLTKNIEI